MMAQKAWWDGEECVQVIGDSAYGGGVPIVLAIMDATEMLGMRPVMLATNPAVVEAAQAAGRDVWEFPGILRRPRPLGDLWAALRLAVALRRRKVKVLHTHTSKAGMVGRLAGRLAGCRLVLHHTHGFYHGGLSRGPKRSAMIGLERFFGRLDDRQIFINSPEFDEAVRLRISRPSQARLCFNGIVEPRACQESAERVRETYALPQSVPLVGSVCRIDFEQKGLDAGVEAFRRVHAAIPQARWVIAGVGDDYDRLERLLDESDLSSTVDLLGRIEDGGSLHRAFDVTFAPSRREGQSVTVLEAMACSTAVVTTRIAGNVDLVEDGRSGVLVEVDDTASMASALTSLLQDDQLRGRLGRAGRELFDSCFSREQLVERIQVLYLEALGAPVDEPTVVTQMRAPHVRDVVRVHLAAFPGFFLTQLGGPFLRIYYGSLLNDPSAVALVAMKAGRVTGFVVGAVSPRGFYSRLLRRRWWAFGLAALPALLRHPGAAGRVFRAVRKPGESDSAAAAAGLFSFAVDPGEQCSGVGTSLLEAFLNSLARSGCSLVRLETDADDNERVNSFYRNKGFIVRREFSTPEGRSMLEYELDISETVAR